MSAPRLLALAQELINLADESGDDAPPAVRQLAEQAMTIQQFLNEIPATGPMAVAEAAE